MSKKPPPEKPIIHNGLLQTDELYKYLLETNVYPREPEPLKELRALTASHPWAVMGTAPDAGQMIGMLLKLVGAKKAIEIGVFTGYSFLLTALTIPDDGKIVAIDMDRESYEIGRPIFKKAGVEHKIEFIESQALPALDKILENELVSQTSNSPIRIASNRTSPLKETTRIVSITPKISLMTYPGGV